MPDQRSVMKEYRSLDEKRLTQGLTPAEASRLEKLRVLMGPESGAGGIKAGFDVNAAAAALRESLLPAGLRNRPPPTPAAAPPEPPPPEPAEPTLGDALAAEYAESPFAALEPAPEAQDALFDPSSLGVEPPPYDPNAQPAYDPNAPQAWDPNQPWDPNAAPQDAAAYPADGSYDPNAQPPYDPNAPQAWDPNQPWDPNAAPAEGAPPAEAGAYAEATFDGEAQPPYDPNAPQAWDADQPWDPNAAPTEGAPPAETGAYADAAYDAGAQPAWDAGASPEAGAELAAQGEVMELGEGELAEAEPAEPLAGEAPPPEGGSFTEGAPEDAQGWEAEPLQPEPPPEAAFGEYDAGAAVEPFAAGTLGAEPPLDASLFDARADAGDAAALAAPEAAGAAAQLGEYDDTAGFAAEPFDASAVPPGAPGLDAGPAAELDAGWQPDAALSGGFELASGGSFGAGADAAAPEWAQSSAPPPWEGTPEPGLEAEPGQPTPEEAGFELSPPPPGEHFGALPGAGADLFGAPEGDLAAPAEESLAGEGAAPELDFSHPDFSGGEEASPDDAARPLAPGFDVNAHALSADELGAAPSLDLAGAPAAEPAWDAPGAGSDLPVDLGAEAAAPAAGDDQPALDLPPEVAELESAELIEATDVVPVEEEPAPAPADEVTGFAEAAAAAVASESTDLSAFIEAPPSVAETPPAEDLSFDVAEEQPAAPDATDAAAFELPEVAAEPGLDALATEAAPVAEEEIPTIDGADILEEIVEDVPAAPAQSLDFEPLEPEPPAPAAAAAPAPVVVAPPPPASAVLAPPAPAPAAVLAPPPPTSAVIAPSAPAPAAVVAPPPPASAAVVAPPAAAAPPPAPAAPDYRVPGAHRVVVHTVEGLVKRGALKDPSLDAPALALEPQPGAAAEEVATAKVKAIFFMLAPGEKAPAAEGKRVRVTFRDGRQIAGFSPDYHDDGIGFFMVPADTKTNTGRIWVYRAAVRQVAVS